MKLKWGRWDRNRTCNLWCWRPHPACRVVLGNVARRHSAPGSLSPHVAACRRVSPCVAGHWGRYWGSRYFRELMLPALRIQSAVADTCETV
jgi:hypothetical protein